MFVSAVTTVVSGSLRPCGMQLSVHGILQSRVLEWVAISFSRDLPDPGIEPWSLASPELAGGDFTTSATREASSVGHLIAFYAAGQRVKKDSLLCFQL